MKKHFRALLVFGAAVISASGSAWAKDIQIVVKNHKFIPDTVVAHPGDKIRWVNEDQDPHNIIEKSAAKTFHSPALDTEDSYTFTAAKTGIYDYFCTFHPTMVGKLVVK